MDAFYGGLGRFSELESNWILVVKAKKEAKQGLCLEDARFSLRFGFGR